MAHANGRTGTPRGRMGAVLMGTLADGGPAVRMPASRPLRTAVATLLAALPWLNPFAQGPSASIQPWLVSMACTLVLWLVAMTAPGTRLRLGWAVVAIVGWAIGSHLSLRPEDIFLAGGLLLIALGATVVCDERIAQGVQRGLLVAAAASAVLGLLQYFGLSSALWPWVSRAVAGDAYANLRQPNQFATLTWIGAAVLLWGTVRVRQGWAVTLVILLAVGSAASASRTAIVEGFALLALVLAWKGPQRRQRLVLCIAAGAAYFAAAWLLPMMLEAATGAHPERTLAARLGTDLGCSSRKVLWANVLHLIAQRPLVGWGWGELDYAHFVTLYDGPRFCDILDNAHDLPLHVAVELGLPAALLLCGGIAWWTWRQRPWAETASVRQLAWAVLALLAIHSMLEYPLWYGPFQIACGVAIGWLAPPLERRSDSRLPVASAALAAVLLVATGYAAWDYDRVSQIYTAVDQRRAAWRDDTLGHTRRSWLFSGQARFAELTLATVTRENARQMHALATDVLHYSPEPRVIERAIESATLLGRDDEAVLQLARFRAAFPKDYRAWEQAHGLPGR